MFLNYEGNQFTFLLVLVLILLMQSCYDYSKTRRSKEFQTNFLKTENINTLIKVKNDHADYWKYNFDKNWYIIGISCFI